MQTEISVRDNLAGTSIVTSVDLSSEERAWFNRIGEKVTHETDWNVTLLAYNPSRDA